MPVEGAIFFGIAAVLALAGFITMAMQRKLSTAKWTPRLQRMAMPAQSQEGVVRFWHFFTNFAFVLSGLCVVAGTIWLLL